MKFFLDEIISRKRTEIFLIAGPCVIESERMCLKNAAALKDICGRFKVKLIFKASFDKANRSAGKAFRGPGQKQGLLALKKVKQQLGLAVTSDIHLPEQAGPAAQVLDVLQIPALLCRQTDLLVAAAKTRLPVNVKKGQFMAPQDMGNVVKKIEGAGNRKIMLTERGSTFGYHNLVVDMRAMPIMREFGYPVVFDATHSVQLPGAGGQCSSGERKFVFSLALAAVAAGCDGLFLEVHQDPAKARCDGANMIDFPMLENLLEKTVKIREIMIGKK